MKRRPALPAVPATPDRLRAETEALRLAQKRCATNASTNAPLLDEQDERFHDGLLQQEVAQPCSSLVPGRSGQGGACAGQSIRAALPRSALLGRVRAACSPRCQ